MADQIPTSFLTALCNKEIDLGTDVFKLALFQSGMTGFNVDTADLEYADLGNESSGTGYTAGGQTAAVTVTQDDANNRVNIDVADTTWTGVTITDYQYVVLYDNTTTVKYVVACHDLGAANSVSAGDVVISFPNDSVRLAAS